LSAAGLAERGARGTVDAHGKLLVANLFVLAEKTATGIFYDTILDTALNNKTESLHSGIEC
jgi:hypothetical protein